ncbi:hypothetical protein RB195_018206 [Necator americanus]|uniref:Uncharacterized protein n=1 Tax=Necator americanus TaxID=51031 RepID=A0ABR1CAX2_NECAM
MGIRNTLNGNQGGIPTELVDEFRYLCCLRKDYSSYERNIHQRCAKANSGFNFLSKCLWLTLFVRELRLRVYPPTFNSSYHGVRIGDVSSAVGGYGEA